ncbi:MAG: alpha/beta hydrolase [Planctomycetota bacterium]
MNTNIRRGLMMIGLSLGATIGQMPFANAAELQQKQAFSLPSPRTTHVVEGGGGVKIAVQEWGNPDGRPIVLIHALVQSHLGYLPLLETSLAEKYRLITFDNRGHGNSEKPGDMSAYQDGDQLADDVAAVVALTGDVKPIVVAWSIGGVILGDYLAKYGDSKISGAVYLGAGHALGPEANKYIGPGFAKFGPAMMSPDLATRASATIAVARANTAKPIPSEQFAFGLATSMVVPPQARAGLVNRSVDHITNTLPLTKVPMRFLHGSADQIVRTLSSKEAAAAAPGGQYVEIEGIGHAPCTESPHSVVQAIEAVMAVSK